MDKIIFFTVLALFPLGQLLKFGQFNLFDISVAVLAIYTIIKKPRYPNWYKYFFYFILFGLFSWIVNYFIFGNYLFYKGILYLLRLFIYSFVPIYIYNFHSKPHEDKSIINNLLTISIISTIIGWIQYIFWPDLTSLKYLGWDDHLLRMVGSFLDPTYLALIIVLGIIAALELKKEKLFYFLLVSLAFTYSRASYLVLGLLLVAKKKFIALTLFAIVVLLIPKMIGEGTNLARTTSGSNKLVNYKETIEIYKKSPIFGIGFNNFCAARNNYLGDLKTNSHSCSGSDSSILFILATTGVVGLFLFINFLVQVPKSKILITSFVAVLIHSLFANSMFYPHIMFWIFVLVGLRSEVNSDRT